MLRVLETGSRIAAGFAFVALMVAVITQVVGRSIIGDSPVWTEELTRFALLYLAAFGAGLSYRSGELVNVDLICEALPGAWPHRLRLLSAILTAVLCLGLILPAWKYTSIGALQTSTALGWRMDAVHATMLVLLVSLFVFSLGRAVNMLRGRTDGFPERRPGDGR